MALVEGGESRVMGFAAKVAAFSMSSDDVQGVFKLVPVERNPGGKAPALMHHP
jgi:hypothetical protein